jgi:hypothetical protein
MSENKTYINFKKADWVNFTLTSEEEISKLNPPTDVYRAEQDFREVINRVSRNTIPQGRIKEIFPEVPTTVKNKILERDELRKTNPQSPQIPELNYEINKLINKHKQEKWREEVGNINRKTDPSKLFNLLKRLNGQPQSKQNQGIRFKGKYLSTASNIANNFNKQYTSVSRHTSSKLTRTIFKESQRNTTSGATIITASDTSEAIKQAKSSKAIGPDGISNLHLKHLGPLGLEYLTNIFNLSLQHSKIPQIWKNSIIIPLLKPGKDPAESKSYRPVSLLCPAAKILERLILPELTEHLPIPNFPHGFRKNHSTSSALNDLNQDITRGFNQKKPADRTVLLQIDLSKAFDMVSHDKLLNDLNKSTLPPFVKRWLSCYLRGRQSKVNFRNKQSKSRNVRTGVPQGAVISPILFNFYLKDLPSPPPGIKVVQYADDISIYSSGKSITSMSISINNYVNKVTDFLEERELLVSPEKSTVTLFTPDSHEAKIHPQIKIKNLLVPLEKHPRLLGVTFDTMHTFNQHAKLTASKASKKINILKSLAGSTWGQSKETLILTYKSICRSVLEYAAPVWAPAISKSRWSDLQTVQNSALRIATGSLLMTNINHLHIETKVLPLEIHSKMITKQYLASTHLPDHPGNKHLYRTQPPRQMKLQKSMNIYTEEVTHRFREQEPTKQVYKRVLKDIHTETVRKTIQQYSENRVLGQDYNPPPPINPDEIKLTRIARLRLSQLRSGFSRLLNSYLNRLDDKIENKCPKCETTPHDTNHLFNCHANPTSLPTTSLWTHPIEASNFLGLEELEDPDPG